MAKRYPRSVGEASGAATAISRDGNSGPSHVDGARVGFGHHGLEGAAADHALTGIEGHRP